MNKGRTKHKGITQTSPGKAASGLTVLLRPNSENVKKPGKSTTVFNDLNAPGGPLTPRLGHEQIAERAKAIWVQRGCPQGQDQANWGEAEAQLRAELEVNWVR